MANQFVVILNEAVRALVCRKVFPETDTLLVYDFVLISINYYGAQALSARIQSKICAHVSFSRFCVKS